MDQLLGTRVKKSRILLQRTFWVLIFCTVLFLSYNYFSSHYYYKLRDIKRHAARIISSVKVILPFTEISRDINELNLYQVRWKSLELHDYSYVIDSRCFCATAGRYTVSVISDTVNLVEGDDNGIQEKSGDMRYFNSIDDLFDNTRNSILATPDVYSVSYDSKTGVPQRIYFDYDENSIDDEGTIYISDIKLIVHHK
jgi:hypothetical protein